MSSQGGRVSPLPASLEKMNAEATLNIWGAHPLVFYLVLLWFFAVFTRISSHFFPDSIWD